MSTEQTYHLLYIEDTHAQREQLAEQLRDHGFRITQAGSGEEGLSAFDQEVHDAILCDLNMPGMSGLEVLRTVRGCCPDTPFVILTAHGSIPEAIESIREGAQHFFLKSGNIDVLISIIHQAVEHVRMAQRLQASESKLRNILKNIPDLVFSMKSDGTIVEVSPAITEILGFQPHEIIGISPDKLASEEEQGEALRITRELLIDSQNGLPTVNFRAKAKDGSIKTLEVSRRVVYNDEGEPVRVDGAARDVTDRVAMEEEVKRYRDELEALVEHRTERLAQANRQLQELNRIAQEYARETSEQDIIARAPRDLIMSLEFDRAAFFRWVEPGFKLEAHHARSEEMPHVNHLLQKYEAGELHLPDEFFEALDEERSIFLPRISELTGPIREIAKDIGTDAAVITPVFVEGKPIGVFVANMQIHVRKMDDTDVARCETFASLTGLAIANARSQRFLEERVAERTLSLKNAYTELKETQMQLIRSEKMASLGMLVAGIAHEINTPIGAVNSMHDTLVRAVAKLRNDCLAISEECQGVESLKKYLDTIDEANKIIQSGTERVTTIVRRLRSFARLDEAELKTVDIHEGIEDTLTLIHHEIKQHIIVERRYGDVPPLSCYPGRLNQVYLNLLNNARQAITESGTITVTTGVVNGMAQISIADTGAGIKPEHLERVFDPGFTTKGVGVGTGLGLSICYGIIEDHRGTITVESETGKGTTFTIRLPLDLDKRLGHEA